MIVYIVERIIRTAIAARCTHRRRLPNLFFEKGRLYARTHKRRDGSSVARIVQWNGSISSHA